MAFINRDPAEIGPRLKQSDVMWQSAGDGLVGRPTEDHILLLFILSAHARLCVHACWVARSWRFNYWLWLYFFPPQDRFRRRILEPKINVFVWKQNNMTRDSPSLWLILWNDFRFLVTPTASVSETEFRMMMASVSCRIDRDLNKKVFLCSRDVFMFTSLNKEMFFQIKRWIYEFSVI